MYFSSMDFYANIGTQSSILNQWIFPNHYISIFYSQQFRSRHVFVFETFALFNVLYHEKYVNTVRLQIEVMDTMSGVKTEQKNRSSVSESYQCFSLVHID